jgi:hypothetical protein
MSLPKLVSMVMRWILSFASGMGLYDTSISLSFLAYQITINTEAKAHQNHPSPARGNRHPEDPM